MSDNISLWVWLSMALGAASHLPLQLLSELGSIDAIYNATEDELERSVKLTRNTLIKLCDKNTDNANGIVEWCENHNVGILTLNDARYPERLRQIKNPPVCLYFIGKIPDFDSKLCISSVGTRNISEYGRINAYKLSYQFAKAGAVVISGLAQGIDSVCHRGALDALGKTVAVLGCGIDNVYPRFNRDLMKEIARKGLLLTEYVPGTKPIGKNFPLRNRIISGLSQATVVYEADRASGSLITARYAREENRKIYALPGMVGELNSLGTNDLIRSGAKILVVADDLLSDFPEFFESGNAEAEEKPKPAVKSEAFAFDNESKTRTKRKMKKQKSEKPEKKEQNTPAPQGLSDIERAIYDMLKKATPKSFDELSALDYPAAELLTALTMLEIKGLIISLPGGAYSRS